MVYTSSWNEGPKDSKQQGYRIDEGFRIRLFLKEDGRRMDGSRLVSQNGFVLGATVLHDLGDHLRDLDEHAGSEAPPHLVQLAFAALPSRLRLTPTASPIPSFSQ